MDLLRTLNRTLGSATGYQIRRVRRSAAATGAKRATHAEARPKAAPGPVAYRPPEDPGRDRLLRRPVFLMCPVRSGSTLLRLMLNAHSRLYAPHELHVRRLEVRCSTPLAERSMRALDLGRGDLEHLLWDRVMHRELVRSGKSTIVEKTPSNAFAYQRIAACWPDARFLFLLRHPASIADSWHEADPDKRSRDEAVLDALRYMRATERARTALPGHTVRYEDLVTDPEAVLKGVCAFLEVEYEPGMTAYGARGDGELQKGLGDWKDKIRSGRVQEGRPLPPQEEIPEPLREISAAWGYAGGAARATATAQAEIEQVWPRDGLIRLVGTVHGWPGDPDGPAWRLRLTPRVEDGAELEFEATVKSGHFEAVLPVADLAVEGLPPSLRWDIHLVTAADDGEARLRVGRHLDDIRQKRKVFVFPEQPARGGGHAVMVRPYYTVKDNLSIECRPQDDPTRAGEEPEAP